MPQPRLSDNDYPMITRVLGDGGIILAPSETCYIFAARATTCLPIRRLFQIKQRPPIPSGILVRDVDMAEHYAYIEPWQKEFVRHFWPGPLSCVFLKKSLLPDEVSASLPSISIRQSPHPFWMSMFQFIDFPVTATSANKHGYPEIYNLKDLPSQFTEEEIIDISIVQSDPLPGLPPSTVLDMQVFPPSILRCGPISQAQIHSILGIISENQSPLNSS